ncbi:MULTISPECIES: hypothetical protein [Paraburkholderia]|uniref:Uncharacterized protein n=1 Tax=Paraburkholderia dipogonis TaxID=1211383 RepID=A0A4Y8MFZ2_9BURK|nr:MULTISPECIES: hypothetical protein [Paraburkholderia]TFE36381.1 hypothetical protein E2553_42150 [Paraburkholderia dipogonis]
MLNIDAGGGEAAPIPGTIRQERSAARFIHSRLTHQRTSLHRRRAAERTYGARNGQLTGQHHP